MCNGRACIQTEHLLCVVELRNSSLPSPLNMLFVIINIVRETLQRGTIATNNFDHYHITLTERR